MHRRSFLKQCVVAAGLAALGPLAGRGLAVPGNGMDNFVLLPGGEFWMGSPAGERQRDMDEVRHRVRLSPFYVDPYEVTQADYAAVMGGNPSENRGDRLPVENVTWLEAVIYCNALSLARGLEPAYEVAGERVTWHRGANGYRLLTEAEWEYAARAGTDTIFNVGNQVHSESVNFEASYPYLIEENYVTRRDPSVRTSRYRGRTMSVDELAPNAFGLYHTHGNVSEWVFDYYGPYADGAAATADSTAVNPAGPASGVFRVNRGGSYIDFGKHLRSAYRSATNPVDADPNLGFRICRNAETGSSDAYPEDSVCAAPFRLAMPANPRVLVAYYSYSGNTENAAEIISKRLGADLFEIRMQNPYRGNIYEVSQIDLNRGFRPPLVGGVDLNRYDVVLLGYPTWWATMPMPVLSFLESSAARSASAGTNGWNGKIVLPFSSHGGTVWGDSVSDLGKTLLRLTTQGNRGSGQTGQPAYVGIGFEFHYSGGRNLAANIDHWLQAGGLLG